jgi:predicted lipoprotein with Yx(FWY)xxD motif
MHKTFRVNAALVGVVALAMGGLLAGCGSSSKSSTATTQAPAATTAPPTTKAATAVVVTAKKSPKLGTILADKSGMTLYTLTNNGKAVACTGACLQVWPPLVATGSSTPKGAAGITGLTVAMGAGGKSLVAVKGLPLYHFVQDKDAGDDYGNGLKSFGGVWHVVKPGQQTVSAVAPPAPTPARAATRPTTPPTVAYSPPMTHAAPPAMHQTPMTRPPMNSGGMGY